MSGMRLVQNMILFESQQPKTRGSKSPPSQSRSLLPQVSITHPIVQDVVHLAMATIYKATLKKTGSGATKREMEEFKGRTFHDVFRDIYQCLE